MSQSELKRMVHDMRQDDGLTRRIMGDDGLDAEIARAREAGYDVTMEDFRTAITSSREVLSDAELDQIAGGGFFQDMYQGATLSMGLMWHTVTGMADDVKQDVEDIF